jgi:hypothetical protein
MKALGHALSRLTLGPGCGQARVLLRKKPEALLDPRAGGMRIHVEECTACRAFERQLRGALAVVPLSPAALGAKLMLGTFAAPSAVAQPAAATNSAPSGGGGLWRSVAAQPKLLAALAAGTLAAAGGGFALSGGDEGAQRTAQAASAAAAIGPRDGRGVFHANESPAEHFAHHPLLSGSAGAGGERG